MSDMNGAVTRIGHRRDRRISRAVSARRGLDRAPSSDRHGADSPRAGGRVWVNGQEVGGTDPRHAGLAFSHD